MTEKLLEQSYEAATHLYILYAYGPFSLLLDVLMTASHKGMHARARMFTCLHVRSKGYASCFVSFPMKVVPSCCLQPGSHQGCRELHAHLHLCRPAHSSCDSGGTVKTNATSCPVQHAPTHKVLRIPLYLPPGYKRQYDLHA